MMEGNASFPSLRYPPPQRGSAVASLSLSPRAEKRYAVARFDKILNPRTTCMMAIFSHVAKNRHFSGANF